MIPISVGRVPRKRFLLPSTILDNATSKIEDSIFLTLHLSSVQVTPCIDELHEWCRGNLHRKTVKSLMGSKEGGMDADELSDPLKTDYSIG